MMLMKMMLTWEAGQGVGWAFWSGILASCLTTVELKVLFVLSFWLSFIIKIFLIIIMLMTSYDGMMA